MNNIKWWPFKSKRQKLIDKRKRINTFIHKARFWEPGDKLVMVDDLYDWNYIGHTDKGLVKARCWPSSPTYIPYHKIEYNRSMRLRMKDDLYLADVENTDKTNTAFRQALRELERDDNSSIQ